MLGDSALVALWDNSEPGGLELASAVHPMGMGPRRAQRIQNMRTEGEDMVVRGGTQLYLSAPVGSATLIDWWSGDVDGTVYLVGAFSVGSKDRIYYSTGDAAWLEATEVGGWSGSTDGDSRFPTQSGRYTFTVIKAPRGLVANATLPSRDVLMIHNGEDPPRLWDPGRSAQGTLVVTGAANNGSGLVRITIGAGHDLATGDTVVVAGVLGTVEANGSWTITRITSTTFDLQGSAFANAWTSGGTVSLTQRLTIHQRLSVPASAKALTQKFTFARFWQVAGAAGKTYYAAGAVNQARFNFANSAAAGYTGSNAIIAWTWQTTAAASDVATVYFAGSGLAIGKMLQIVTENATAGFGADQMLSHVKIEVNTEDVAYNLIATAWQTLYDPVSTDEKERRYTVESLVSPSGETRQMWSFSAEHLASPTIYHIRVTRAALAPAPGANATLYILNIMGGGSIRGTSEATLSWEDEPGRSESRRYVAPDNAAGAPLWEVGGPKVVNSTQGIFTIPVSSSVLYDLDIVAANAEGADTIEGGLNGQPSRINVYLRCPRATADGTELEDEALYFYSHVLYSPGTFSVPFVGRGWSKASSAQTVTIRTSDYTNAYGVDWTARDPDRPAPSDYQICMPPAYAAAAGSGRVFLGDVEDESGTRQRGDIYVSGLNRPFRWQAIITGETSGFRTLINAERIRAFVISAAMFQGASYCFPITNAGLYALGGSGPDAGAPTDSVQLSVVVKLLSKGTNCPRSVIEHNGAIFFLDHTGQFRRVLGEAPAISRGRVDDVPRNVPAARRDDVSGCFVGDRAVWAYTDAGQTTNRRILGWNDEQGRWEFDDLPVVAAERMLVLHDPAANGSGQRWLIGRADGAVYRYDVAGADDLGASIAARLTFGAMVSPSEDRPIQVETVYLDAEEHAASVTIDRIYYGPDSTWRTTASLSGGWVHDEEQAHTSVSAPNTTDKDERGRAAQVDIYGNLATGKRIRSAKALVVGMGSHETKAGS